MRRDIEALHTLALQRLQRTIPLKVTLFEDEKMDKMGYNLKLSSRANSKRKSSRS